MRFRPAGLAECTSMFSGGINLHRATASSIHSKTSYPLPPRWSSPKSWSSERCVTAPSRKNLLTSSGQRTWTLPMGATLVIFHHPDKFSFDIHLNDDASFGLASTKFLIYVIFRTIVNIFHCHPLTHNDIQTRLKITFSCSFLLRILLCNGRLCNI